MKNKNKIIALVILSISTILFGIYWITLAKSEDSQAVWDGLLISFIFITPLATGLPVLSAIVRLSKGKWIGDLERITLFGIGFGPFSIVILSLLWAGADKWVPWITPTSDVSRWLSMPGTFIRDMIALIIYWILTLWYLIDRKKTIDPIWSATAITIGYCLLNTLLAIDLVMSLVPSWSSSIFGAYVFITGLNSSVVFLILLAISLVKSSLKQRSDLGNLIISLCAVAAYLMFCQLITIWFENVPRETSYVVPRVNYEPWRTIGWILIAIVYIGPIALLMPAAIRNNRFALFSVCLVIFIGLMIERMWLIVPGRDSLDSVLVPMIVSYFFVLSLLGVGLLVMSLLLSKNAILLNSETN